MPTTIRFPFPTTTSKHAAETNQIIALATAIGTLRKGGQANYADISAWKVDGALDEAPYIDVMIEFVANTPVTIGDGTSRIGLFGQIGSQKFLIGVLGIPFGNTAPQIPLVQDAAAAQIGFAQVVCNVAAYDKLSVGGVSGDIGLGDPTVTITARPIRKRIYGG